MVMVRLDRVTKVYDADQVAVDGVDLTIHDGEFFVVLGPSGCGKTSLLRMLAGLEEITSGDVLVDGRSVRNMLVRRRGLGMLFQQSALYPHLTVRENIGFPLKMAGTRKREIDHLVEEVAELVGVAGALDLKPSRLSGGMAQRVAMARTLVRDPTMLLMDEPMSNLDAKLRTALRSELAELQRRIGATTVYVTHDQVEAMALGDRAAVMRAGRIVQCASPTELYERPADLFVASFVGSPPMNLVRARVDRADGEYDLDLGHERLALADAGRWPGIDAWVGRDVVVGIRAEGLRLGSDFDSNAVKVEIVHMEHLGSHRLASATLEANAVRLVEGVAAVDRSPVTTIEAFVDEDVDVSLWRPVPLVVDTTSIHLFDLDSGAAIPTVGYRPASV